MARKTERTAHSTDRPSKPRKRRESKPGLVTEQAAAYGVTLPPDQGADRFLSPNDIGKILNITGEAVKQWIYQRRLPAVKLANGYWKVRIADFEAFLKARHDVGRRRVLLTGTKDDEMPDFTRVVEELGHQPITAHNYADALLKSLDHQPALFVINIAAEAAEPWRLCEKIRSTKALRAIPILLVAGKDLSEQEAERAIAIGAQGFLRRPLDADTVKQEVERILTRSL